MSNSAVEFNTGVVFLTTHFVDFMNKLLREDQIWNKSDIKFARKRWWWGSGEGESKGRLLSLYVPWFMVYLPDRITVVYGCRKTSWRDVVERIESAVGPSVSDNVRLCWGLHSARRRDGSSITTLSYSNRLQFFIVRITFTPSVCSRNQHDVIYDPDQREQRSRICKLLVSFTSTTDHC